MNKHQQQWLLEWFWRVPQRHTTTYDWHVQEGQAFLQLVDRMVEHGADINEIGSVIGIPNFSQRYRILRRGQVGKNDSTAVTYGVSNEDPQPQTAGMGTVLPEVWRDDETEGEELHGA